jgi:calcineurin-like phosphoesterase family protein
MNEKMIYNHNCLVKPDDIVLWVGDVSFGDPKKTYNIINRLNGYKILVVGNHDFDRKRKLRKMGFDETHIVYNLTVGDTKVAFTHYPMDNLPEDWINTHGHIHKNGNHVGEVETTSHINVNCEFQDYKPINLNTLVTKISELAEANKHGKRKPAIIDYTEYD